jgi:NADH-quinone oxidoreductase subunit A
VNEYIPILVLGGIALAFALFSVGIAPFTGPSRYSRAKLDRYESGIEPSPLPEGGGKVSIKYFFTAMMFIVFDIEVVFLLPFAVAFDELSWFAFFAVMLFLLNITIAYVYEWRRGGMDWT